MDGLGRLQQVTESALGATTSYSYDALNDLMYVTPPSGFSGRSFSYSSLGRLESATNPESGITSYSYDPNGNVKTKTIGGSHTTTYTYDGLDELTNKQYSDSTPAVAYGYTNGWRASVSVGGVQAYSYSYDGLGRVSGGTQTTQGISYPFTSYTYDLLDDVTSMKLPSGRTITTAYDVAGRPASVSSQLPGGQTVTYATVQTYAPHGAPTQIALNNGLTEQTCFNGMLQPVVIRQRTGGAASCTNAAPDASDVGFLSYAFPATNNNGNVLGQTIQYGASGGVPAKSFQQTYSYTEPNGQSANRLTGMTETWTGSPPLSQAFQYDTVGNRWLSGGSQLDPLTPTANGYDGNNHLSGLGYGDGRGNVTQMGGATYQYDAENRLVASTVPATAYTYDGDGRRVVKQTANVTTHYVYDPQGALAAEYTVAGTAPATPCTGTCYVMADHLGSTRMLTDGGKVQKQLVDYAPFGEPLAGYDGRDARWNGVSSGVYFTGQERDGETGLDYFGARYFSGAQGRFTSPDEPFVDQHPEEPQSWNLYTYGRNNPLAYIDPSGQYVCGKSVSTDQCDSFQKSLDQAQTAANALKDTFGADSSQYKQAQGAISAYGGRGDVNGVTINVGDTGKYGAITTVANAAGPITDQNKNGQNINVTFNAAVLSPDSSVPTLVAHEGSHVADASAYVSSGFSPNADPTNRTTETKAYQVQANIGIGLGWLYQTVSFAGQSPYLLQFRSWPQANSNNVINGILTHQYTNLDKPAFPRGVVKVTK